jgi:hypothetical protein
MRLSGKEGRAVGKRWLRWTQAAIKIDQEKTTAKLINTCRYISGGERQRIEASP